MRIADLGDNWFHVYQRCLELYDVKRAIQISHFYKPKKLYKYFSFDNYWIDNLKNGTIVFNSTYNFNDPLDSRWSLDYKYILKSRFKDVGQGTNFVNKFINDIGKKRLITLYEEDLLYLHDLYRISCFSETPCSNLMWGHYADKHKGFCLEYDVEKLTKELPLLLPVVYTENPFDASDILDMRGIDDKFAVICPALFKSKDWSYEKEWRMIRFDRNDEIELYNVPDAITGVFLGFNTFSSDVCDKVDKLEKIANEMNITIYRMERSYLSYDLVYSSISDIKNNNGKGFMI